MALSVAVPHEPSAHLRLPALDGVRGIAILFVLAFHFRMILPESHRWLAPLRHLADPLWVGVDLFFVLSGFLITGILLDSREDERYYKAFYARRALRIFPLYYATLAIVAVLRAAKIPVLDWLVGGGSLAAATFYVSNLVMAAPGGLARVPWSSLHFWSLSIEEQFYLLWPLTVRRLSLQRLAIVCALVLVASPVLRFALLSIGVPAGSLYLATPTRLDALSIGALLAALSRSSAGWRLVLRARGWAALISLAVAIIAMRQADSDPTQGPTGSGLLSTVGFSALAVLFASLLSLALEPGRVARALGHPALLFFGKYSYGLYVLHPFVGFFSVYALNRLIPSLTRHPTAGPLIGVLLALVTTVAAALLSWRLLEWPMLRLQRTLAPRATGRRGAEEPRAPCSSDGTLIAARS